MPNCPAISTTYVPAPQLCLLKNPFPSHKWWWSTFPNGLCILCSVWENVVVVSYYATYPILKLVMHVVVLVGLHVPVSIEQHFVVCLTCFSLQQVHALVIDPLPYPLPSIALLHSSE